MSLNMSPVSDQRHVLAPPALIRLATIVGVLGGISTVLGTVIPGFLAISQGSIVTLAGEDISGSYLSSPLIANKTMGAVLGAVGIIAVITAVLTWSWWVDQKKLAVAMALLLASGSYDIVFSLVYLNDPHIQDAYSLGARFGLGQGMVVLGATFLTVSGIMAFIHGMRMSSIPANNVVHPAMLGDNQLADA